MNYTDYVRDIAKVNKKERYDAITGILENKGIGYSVDEIGNIIVRFNKNNDVPNLVISAHYDNVTGTPGANDNAAACSILLNLIENWRGHGIDTPVTFVFFDLEERGFMGSKYFHDCFEAPIGAVINLDMCGLGSNTLISVSNTADIYKQIIADAVSANEGRLMRRLPPGDANTFINKGIPTFYIVNSTDHDLEYFEAYAEGRFSPVRPDFLKTMHGSNDTPDTLNQAQIEKISAFTDSLAVFITENGIV